MPGIDQTLGGKIFSLNALADQLRTEMEFAVKNKDMRKAIELNDRINEIDNKRVQMMAKMGDKEMMIDTYLPKEMKKKFIDKTGRYPSLGMARDLGGEAGRITSNLPFETFAEGGEAFPDLTGDNKITQADILKGRGVFQEGGEAEMEMEMEPEGEDIQESLMAIQSVSQEAAPLDQIVQQVVQMIQQGATEEQVIGMLKQMGLDDEDIAAVFQAVIEMLQGPSIDSELAALG